MLHLPPALRGLLARACFRHNIWTDPALSAALVSGSRRYSRRDGYPSFLCARSCYATTSSENPSGNAAERSFSSAPMGLEYLDASLKTTSGRQKSGPQNDRLQAANREDTSTPSPKDFLSPSTYDIEKDFILRYLRHVEEGMRADDQLPFRHRVDDALQSQDPLHALHLLADATVDHARRTKAWSRLVDCSSVKARMLSSVLQLETAIKAQISSAVELEEVNELLHIVKHVEDLWGLLSYGPSNLEALVRSVDFARDSNDPLGILRLIVLESPMLKDNMRVRTCEKIQSGTADPQAFANAKAALSELHRAEDGTSARAKFPQHVLDTDLKIEICNLPAKEDLPLADPSLWTPARMRDELMTRCRKLKLRMNVHEQPHPSIKPPNECKLSVHIPGLCQENAHGIGLTMANARSSAWAQMLSKMHLSGNLAKLFTPGNGALDQEKQSDDAFALGRVGAAAEKHKKASIAPSNAALAPSQLKACDYKHVQSTCKLPSEAEYPSAPEDLFDAVRASSALHNACTKGNRSFEAEASYTAMHPSREQRRSLGSCFVYYGCDLKVTIHALAEETAYGEGRSKKEARRAAFVQVISKLHVSGALADIFPGSNVAALTADKARSSETGAVQEPAQAEAVGLKGVDGRAADQTTTEDGNLDSETLDDGQAIDLVQELDESTLRGEKDAKVDIYNYAAAFGFVPEFEHEAVRPITFRDRRLAKLSKRNPTRAKVNVDGLCISVSAVGIDARTAEVAAILDFKRKAEEREELSPSPIRAYRALSTDTSKRFFNFLKDRGKAMSLELEQTSLEHGGHQATLLIDDAETGSTVVLSRKKDAQAVAYLTAALVVAKQHPELLQEFEKSFDKSRGKALSELKPMRFELDTTSAHVMQTGLIEAHAAGLPATRDLLLAETSKDLDTVWRRSRLFDGQRASNLRQSMLNRQNELDADESLQDLRDKRAALPMSQYRSNVLEMIDQHVYSIVVGATGSGKTTQVPQILFEEGLRRPDGSLPSIICTQPRRIAATSVARRVAEERNERLRTTVGYHVRFDAQPSHSQCGINYCTTGILLERLKHDPDGVLDASSHILIDEVHERDRNIDFLMIVLKKAILARQAEGKPVPKVVLMSATLDTDLFANYFRQPDEGEEMRPAPCLSVPGRTFAVKDMYLGSIMHDLYRKHGAEVRALVEDDGDSKNYLRIETEFSSKASRQTGPGRASIIDWKREHSVLGETDDELSAKAEKEEALVPVGLLAATVGHICATTPNDGAVLAFLPGMEEISKTQTTLMRSPIFGQNFSDNSKFKVCLLHSAVPKEQQQEIFQKLPKDCRRIILSTNLAETSVTIPDVKYVVDTGKLREIRYDQARRITQLQCVWESKSNSKQRMGRAGRVQDGYYYALFSKERADSLKAIGLPELLRSDLQDTCLSIASRDFDEPIASFLSQAIEPPSTKAVDTAISNLVDVEALTKEEKLTVLGRVLSKLPVHPSLAKMIMVGIVFKCLDPMIALGAAAEERPLFIKPLAAREEAARIHRAYAGETGSDQLAYLAAVRELRQLQLDNGRGAVAAHGRAQFLHVGAFYSIERTAQQIAQILKDCGLISSVQDTGSPSYGPAELNINSDNSDLVKSLLLAGSYPNLAIKLKERALRYRAPNEDMIIMHPSSVNRESTKAKDRFFHPANTIFTYAELARSNDGKSLFQRGTTQVTPLMALLFGGPLRMADEGATLEMDGWATFKLQGFRNEFNAKLILEFRKAMDRVLQRAYASLADVGEREGPRGFAEDPLRERFVQRVVEVLNGGESEARRMQKMIEEWSAS